MGLSVPETLEGLRSHLTMIVLFAKASWLQITVNIKKEPAEADSFWPGVTSKR